jgi:hypothetical protein
MTDIEMHCVSEYQTSIDDATLWYTLLNDKISQASLVTLFSGKDNFFL